MGGPDYQRGEGGDLRNLRSVLVFMISTLGVLCVQKAVAVPPSPSTQATSTGVDFFEKNVQSILQSRCIKCHGPEKQRGSLRLDKLSGIIKGGVSGPAVVPHHPEKSLLIRAVQYRGELQMPPGGRLSEDQIKVLTSWVEMGVPSPDVASSRPQKAPNFGSSSTPPEDLLWSLHPVKSQVVPAVKNQSWPQNPIDFFVLAKLEKEGLTPAAPADKETLIRRVTFDLIGLPPTRQEIEAFLADQSSEAYPKLVDRLLASPHYGEHWGRHWLDLACYAETNGTKDFTLVKKLQAYRYRDYVIQSFNDDVPYRQFILEQIAGDLLVKSRKDTAGAKVSIAGAGFLWMREMPPIESAASDAGVIRADFVADQIDVVGKAFLGLTLACARCHDHKFDPISQEDYYALAGYFYSSQVAQANLFSPSKPFREASERKKLIETRREIDIRRMENRHFVAALERLDEYLLAVAALWVDAKNNSESDAVPRVAKERGLDPGQLRRWFKYLKQTGMVRDPVFGPWVVLMCSTPSRYQDRLAEWQSRVSCRSAMVDEDNGSAGGRLIFSALTAPGIDSLPAAARVFKSVVQQAFHTWGQPQVFDAPSMTFSSDHLDSNRATEQLVDYFLRKNSPTGAVFSDEDLPTNSQIEIKRLRRTQWELTDKIFRFALSTEDDQPQDVPIHIRGDCKNCGAVVPRRFIKVLTKSKPISNLSGSGRLDLAQRIADSANPLTSRVFVNRCWQHHFSEGLVRTPDNFGQMGEPPTHPELLDFLAAGFIESGWSVKTLHRLILLSNTYRMSSKPSAEAEIHDPDNKLLQHTMVRRLAAEEIRDAMLAATGCLDPTCYGPSVLPVSSGGPLDGGCRRSIYINVRRGQITPLLLEFDFPNPQLCIGKRYVSIVPSQSLILMNNAFVHFLSQRWGEQRPQALQEETSGIQDMFFRILGRLPTREELLEAEKFLREQAVLHHSSTPESAASRSWADLAHCLFATNGFLFVR